MRKLLRLIDSVTDYAGSVVMWFCYVLVLVVVYDVLMRYAFTAPTMWAHETAIMLGGSIYALAWAYTHRHNGHVRVDVFYLRLSPRGRAIIDVVGGLFFWLPLALILLNISFSWAWRAWVIGEKSTITYWYPPLAPFRTVVVIGFCLLAFQALAHLFRDSYLLIKGKAYD